MPFAVIFRKVSKLVYQDLVVTLQSFNAVFEPTAMVVGMNKVIVLYICFLNSTTCSDGHSGRGTDCTLTISVPKVGAVLQQFVKIECTDLSMIVILGQLPLDVTNCMKSLTRDKVILQNYAPLPLPLF